jgi:hypothetical protein
MAGLAFVVLKKAGLNQARFQQLAHRKVAAWSLSS